MPLILEPERHSVAALEELLRSLRSDLDESRDLFLHPRGRALDPASLETAESLLLSTLEAIDAEGPRDATGLAAKVNLAYASLLAVIDLVKSHSDVPRVPAARKSSPP